MKPSKIKLSGKIQTVTGLISGEQMGITLSHEHCLVDNRGVFLEPKKASEIKLAYEKLSFENVGYIRYNVLKNRDNLLMADEDLAIKELLNFKYCGGQTIVDASNDDLGRDPMAIKKISLATGLNIVMGSGYYVNDSHPKKMATLTEKEIAEEIIRDIFQGAQDTDICSGLIGEIGCSWPLTEAEKKVLKGAAIAQKKTGAALQVHPGRNPKAPFEIIDILKKSGADITHTAICHIERTIPDSETLYRLAETGCFLEFDLVGLEGYYPETLAIVDLPSDAQRIATFIDLISRGYGEKILVSHDLCYKCRYSAYGGHGYNHILVNTVPAMRRRGMNKTDIDKILIKNPKEFFSFR
jgi:phosphotriesterase-related protein